MAQKISIIIPNFNGKNLLVKNLPKVIENSPDCEIIVVDDASTDDSVSFLEKSFKEVKVIKHKKNKGFSVSANDGVDKAAGPLVLLLNSDVSPRRGYILPSLKHFSNKKDLFAVGFADHSHEKDKVVTRGRGGAVFERGFPSHFALDPKRGETLWVSGGSGLFSREKFLELGGFDTTFAPFYWEDIDLCFRAWQRGYRCLFEPSSSVDHFHEEGAIKKSKSQFFVKTVSYKNLFLFSWKNISDTIFLIQHLLWLPFHLTKAVFAFDSAFFLGFFWAIIQLPKLIFNSQNFSNQNLLTDKEVLKKFEKQ